MFISEQNIIRGDINMKKLILCLFTSVLFFCGCTKTNSKDTSNVALADISNKLIETADFDNAVIEDLTNTETAERYGISTDDIESGIVYYTSDEDKADKILIAKAKDEKALENVEKAFSAEIVGLADTWSNYEFENKKVEEHILKTQENFVVLLLSDDPDELEKTFDSFFDNK